MRTLSLGRWLAAFAGLALLGSAGLAQQDKQADSAPPVKQVKLTEKKIQAFIAAQKQLAPLSEKLQAEQPDPAVDNQVEQIAKSNGFASSEELGDVSANITLVLAGLDASTGQFTEPPDQIRKEIEEIKQDTKMSQQDKDEALAQAQQALKTAAPVKFKENVTLVKKYQKELDQVVTDDTAQQPGSKKD